MVAVLVLGSHRAFGVKKLRRQGFDSISFTDSSADCGLVVCAGRFVLVVQLSPS